MFSSKSAVAGILDAKGGLRVVVTSRWRMWLFHRQRGERLFVVPKLRVREPVSIGDAAPLIETVTRYVETHK